MDRSAEHKDVVLLKNQKRKWKNAEEKLFHQINVVENKKVQNGRLRK